MGVVRDYAKCTVCGCKMVLRIGVGNELSCTHTFDCPSCHIPISVDLKTGGPGEAWTEAGDNLESIAFEEGVENIVNLQPAFAFHAEEYRSQWTFASMRHMDMTKGKLRLNAESRFQDFSTQFAIPDTTGV